MHVKTNSLDTCTFSQKASISHCSDCGSPAGNFFLDTKLHVILSVREELDILQPFYQLHHESLTAEKFDACNRNTSLLGRGVKTVSKVVKSFTDSQVKFLNDPCALMEALSKNKKGKLAPKVLEFQEIKKHVA